MFFVKYIVKPVCVGALDLGDLDVPLPVGGNVPREGEVDSGGVRRVDVDCLFKIFFEFLSEIRQIFFYKKECLLCCPVFSPQIKGMF